MAAPLSLLWVYLTKVEATAEIPGASPSQPLTAVRSMTDFQVVIIN